MSSRPRTKAKRALAPSKRNPARTPFDAPPARGRTFSVQEIEARRKFFSRFFSVPHGSTH